MSLSLLCTDTTSFLYQGICHWNNLPLEIKQCPSKATFKYQVKCLLYSRLFVQETSLYVRSVFCIFYQMIVISIMCRVMFSEYCFKDHIGNKCTLVCFNVSSLVRLHACSLLVCHVFL